MSAIGGIVLQNTELFCERVGHRPAAFRLSGYDFGTTA
jgi:hypothetical protein